MTNELEGTMGAPVAWFEITSREPSRLVDFYRELFGWTISDSPDSTYALVETGAGADAIGGGIGVSQGPDDPGGVTVYLRVDDLQAALDKAESLGGSALVPPTDLPDGFGRFAMFSDPAGHPIGLWS
jgi:predicted enzyme related to lactoylglutathione lyase